MARALTCVRRGARPARKAGVARRAERNIVVGVGVGVGMKSIWSCLVLLCSGVVMW
jgi:hypothetical protein